MFCSYHYYSYFIVIIVIMLQQWKSHLTEESYDKLVHFIEQTESGIPLNNAFLVLYGSKHNTIRLTNDIIDLIGTDNITFDIEHSLLHTLTKKLVVFPCEDQDYIDEKQGIIKTIVCRDSFVCRDTQLDEGIKYNSICNVMLLTENINLLNSSMLQRSIVVTIVDELCMME